MKIQKQCSTELKKLEREKDVIKLLRLNIRIQKKVVLILMKELGQLTDTQWQKWEEEIIEPLIKQSLSISGQLDSLAYKEYRSPQEYKKYERMKRISTKAGCELFDLIGSMKLTRKQLERFLVLILNQAGLEEISKIQNRLDFYEFHYAAILVQKRLGFDYNWLYLCL